LESPRKIYPQKIRSNVHKAEVIHTVILLYVDNLKFLETIYIVSLLTKETIYIVN